MRVNQNSKVAVKLQSQRIILCWFVTSNDPFDVTHGHLNHCYESIDYNSPGLFGDVNVVCSGAQSGPKNQLMQV